ncbi:MAG: SET domain-containing protein [Pseudolabrys sp.]
MTRKPFRIARSRTGLGLFATRDIKKRAAIVEYSGRRIRTVKAKELEYLRPNRYLFEINSRWTIDGSSRRNLARYVNHACKPNAEAVLARGRIIYRALKRIREAEEITVDYGKEYFDLYLKASGCLCLSCIEKRREKRRLARARHARKAARSKTLQSRRRAKTMKKQTAARRKTSGRT